MAGKRKPTGPDWGAIRDEYLAGAKPRELVSRHGVTGTSLQQRIKRGKWAEQRDALVPELDRKRTEKIGDVVAGEAEQATRRQLEVVGRAHDVAASLLLQVADVGELKDWATAYKSIQAIQRLALGLDRPAPVAAQEGPDSGLIIVPADSDDWRSLGDD